ncbi:MAG: thiamine pyrophosphate-dependent dehydrogenase E1 component subunit alpha [Beijerinckiaceae bacterium]|nr:thiamine pyrophosphate-dependent dehydrogenase E1 component subunit alpha [Beijerinckiaceae bacterium]
MISVLSKDECLEALRKMLMIRRFEEACIDAAQENKVPGHFHVYIGQEATGVGVMATLDPGDYVHSTHRNHGHLIARGADPNKALAEILGKAGGYAGGKAGTLHGCAPDLNFPLSSGIVAGILPIAVGTAYGLRVRKLPNVSVVFFGDGAMEEGAAYEALNLAALWKLPVLFVCENNTAEVDRRPGGGQYHAPNMSIIELTDLARIMGITTQIVDGLDLGAVWTAARDARNRAVNGEGPTFFEIRTNTWPGGQWPTLVTGRTDISHAWTNEVPAQYEKNANWFKRNDPVLSVAREMLKLGVASHTEIEAIDIRVRNEIDAAVKFANDSPFPSLESALTDVWPN